MKPVRRRRRVERGAVAVEFALIMPVLLLIMFGTIEFGRVYSQYQVFQGAAREGARCAAVQAAEAATGLPVCGVQAAIEEAAGPYADRLPGAYSVVVAGGGGACTADTIGRNVTVSWDQDFDLNIPFWNEVTVTANVDGTFRCE